MRMFYQKEGKRGEGGGWRHYLKLDLIYNKAANCQDTNPTILKRSNIFMLDEVFSLL
jgi:hypothetical protein